MGKNRYFIKADTQVTNKYMKMSTNSSLIKTIQIRTN
jgi:hypothetical protein